MNSQGKAQVKWAIKNLGLPFYQGCAKNEPSKHSTLSYLDSFPCKLRAAQRPKWEKKGCGCLEKAFKKQALSPFNKIREAKNYAQATKAKRSLK